MENGKKVVIDDTSAPAKPDNGTVVLDLQYPLDAEFKSTGQTQHINSLTIRRIKGHDQLAAEKIKDETQKVILLFERLTGLSRAVFEQLDGADIAAFIEVIENFIPDSQKTGKK